MQHDRHHAPRGHGDHPHGPGHNHAQDGEHLHSHLHQPDEAADPQALAEQFVDGFIRAGDKPSYLRLAGVPLERPGTGTKP